MLTFSLRPKGVRIDYNTVVPHVDFGGEELISREVTSITSEEIPKDENVLARIFGETEGEPVQDIIKEILTDILVGYLDY